MNKRFVIIFLSLIIFVSCEKEKEYSFIPEISLKNFYAQYEETPLGTSLKGKLSFSFTDGDGDIGFLGNDTANNPIYDIFIKEYKLENNVETLYYEHKYWMPFFPDKTYDKTLKGEILVNLTRTLLSPDTVYYEFYILDRANHESNVITTPVYIYSELSEQ